MKSRSKPNNLFALLIALFLITAGFVLAFIHRQSESSEKKDTTPVAVVTGIDSQQDKSIS